MSTLTLDNDAAGEGTGPATPGPIASSPLAGVEAPAAAPAQTPNPAPPAVAKKPVAPPAGPTAAERLPAALVQGLRTGAADTDHDGHVSVDDAYAYVFDQVQAPPNCSPCEKRRFPCTWSEW